MHKKINILVIGIGSIGKRHVDILSAMPLVNKIDLVTKRRMSSFNSFLSLDKIPDLNKYDYFLISSETWKHFDQLKYLEQRIANKIILVEKPIFEKSQALNIQRNQVYVSYNLRFHPVLEQIIKWIEFENVLSVQATVAQYLPSWRSDVDYRESYSASKAKGGGVLLDLSHELDYIQWLFGKIVKLEAISGKISKLEIDSDDYLALIGKTNKGIFVTLNMDYLSKIPQRNVLIQTETSTIQADLISGKLIRDSGGGAVEHLVLPKTTRNETFHRLHHSMIYNNAKDCCTYNEALMTLQIIDTIRKLSDKKGWNDAH